MSADRKWRKGPPPHIGWWNASNAKVLNVWRWWNGEQWSVAAYPEYASTDIARVARRPDAYQERIEWSDYYPEAARVPRVAP